MTVQKHENLQSHPGKELLFYYCRSYSERNLSRWSLVKFLICRMGTQCLAIPCLYCSCERPRRGSQGGFDKGAVSLISVKITRIEENQSFLLADFGSFLVGPTSLVKDYLLTLAKFSEGQAKLSTEFLDSYISLLILKQCSGNAWQYFDMHWKCGGVLVTERK